LPLNGPFRYRNGTAYLSTSTLLCNSGMYPCNGPRYKILATPVSTLSCFRLPKSSKIKKRPKHTRSLTSLPQGRMRWNPGNILYSPLGILGPLVLQFQSEDRLVFSLSLGNGGRSVSCFPDLFLGLRGDRKDRQLAPVLYFDWISRNRVFPLETRKAGEITIC
jgi:hypothetical protein